jgi:hypothetical protein
MVWLLKKEKLEKDVEEYGGGPFQGTIPLLAWMDRG